MIEVEVTDDIVRRAKVLADDLGILRNSITGGEGNLAGFIGEIIVNDIVGGDLVNTFDYDITKNHSTIDVKTKRCTSPPKEHYECSIAAFNTTQKCDYYVFVRVEWHKDKPERWSKAWILGFLSKADYFSQARKLNKGEIDTDNNFIVKADCFNLPITKLKPITELVMNLNDELKGLSDLITECTRCPLSCHRGSGNVQIVPGHGQPRSRIVLVGEAPGENEDLIGEPFVGLAGNMLDKIMAEAGIKREEVYITNTVKCRPTTKKGKKKSNRAPVDKEIQSCKTWLYQELKLIQPKIVIPLGKVPTKLLLKIPKANFTMKDYLFKDHIVDYLNNFIVLPCWHPSYILRSPSTLMPEGVRVFKRAYDLMNNKYAELQG